VIGLSGHQVAEALIPVIIGAVVDEAIGTSDLLALTRLLAILAIVFAGLIICWRVATRTLTRVYSGGEHDLRLRAARKVLDPNGVRHRRSTGDVLAIATNDSSSVSGLAWLIAEMGASSAAIITAIIALALISWPLAAIVIVATIIQLVLIHRLRGPLAARAYAEQERAAEAGALATDFATGIRVVKGMGAEAEASARYRRVSRGATSAALHSVRASAGLSALNTTIGGVFVTVIAVAAGWFALDGAISVGELVAVVGLAQFVRAPMQYVGLLGAYLASKNGSARRLSELLSADQLTTSPTALPPASAFGRPTDGIALRFRTQGGEIVVRDGELLGLQPSDGNEADELMARLSLRLPAAPGTYSIGGIDAAELGAEAVRRLVYAPPRAGTVFTGSVADNLHSTPVADRPQVNERMLTVSGFDEVLRHLPSGTASSVGEQGRSLSGGQRQRLLLARALHQTQSVLVLHEPTTSVDSVTEHRIAQGIRTARGENRTILLVTGSPALLAACDRVIQLNGSERAALDTTDLETRRLDARRLGASSLDTTTSEVHA
jgi:ABC-type bacteriocin/lantibiotic exporter with double-glycine peptidase domain